MVSGLIKFIREAKVCKDIDFLYYRIITKEEFYQQKKTLMSYIGEEFYLIASGATTMVLESKKEEKVICLCNDIFKVLYLKKAKVEDFKFLKIIKVLDNYLFLYEINKLTDIEDFDSEMSMSLDMNLDSSCDSYVDTLGVLEDFNIESSLNSCVLESLNDHIFNRYIGFDLDMHAFQFMVNSNNKIVCVDPIISSNIAL